MALSEWVAGAAEVDQLKKAVRIALLGITLAIGLLTSGGASAQTAPEVYGKIQWGAWIDQDGCMHWWADGGLEGYMLDRVNPKTGKPVCLKVNTCLSQNTDTLFATDSAKLTATGRKYLTDFFRKADAFGYGVYGFTDSRASSDYNLRLSQRRAKAVADVARSVGGVVEREIGYGERQPVATNKTAAGMKKNRRVEVVCYRW